MPYLLKDLEITRVDLVNEGANSAAFIELFKRKEPMTMTFEEILKSMKPEHAAVITAEITKAKDETATAIAAKNTAETDAAKAKNDLATANANLEAAKKNSGGFCTCDKPMPDADGICKNCGKPVKGAGVAKSKDGDMSDEVLKSLPPEVQAYVKKCREDNRQALEKIEQIEKAKKESEAIAKAASLKALPVDQKVLVEVIQKSDEQMLGVLTAVNKAIEDNVLHEVGKSNFGTPGAADAYTKLEAKATEIRKARPALTSAQAFTQAVQDNPDLYSEYVQGGAK
jgi:hypothetical protein